MAILSLNGSGGYQCRWKLTSPVVFFHYVISMCVENAFVTLTGVVTKKYPAGRIVHICAFLTGTVG